MTLPVPSPLPGAGGLDQAAVDARVVAVAVDGAPALLDTMNEIAAAINDDPAFFTNLVNGATAALDTFGEVETELGSKVGNGAGVTDLYVGADPGAVANGAVWFDTP